MAKGPKTRVAAKSAAKSRGKAQNRKSRAAPLATAIAKKTTLAHRVSKEPHTVNRGCAKQKRGTLLPAKMETILDKTTDDFPAPTAALRVEHEEERTADARAAEDAVSAEAVTNDVLGNPAVALRARIKALGLQIAAPLPDMAAEAAVGTPANAMPRTASIALTPLGMMVRHQAFAFNLMLDVMQMQRRLLEFWRPRQG